MTYVYNKQKELKTAYKADTPEVGHIINLEAQDGSIVLRRNKVGIK
jgi:hypothetical protein